MTRPPSKKYPWHRMRRGEYFFVPALDLPATELAGLRVAARQNLAGVKAYQCVYKGMLGVMFKR
jgi:hypothetical protein